MNECMSALAYARVRRYKCRHSNNLYIILKGSSSGTLHVHKALKKVPPLTDRLVLRAGQDDSPRSFLKRGKNKFDERCENYTWGFFDHIVAFALIDTISRPLCHYGPSHSNWEWNIINKGNLLASFPCDRHARDGSAVFSYLLTCAVLFFFFFLLRWKCYKDLFERFILLQPIFFLIFLYLFFLFCLPFSLSLSRSSPSALSLPSLFFPFLPSIFHQKSFPSFSSTLLSLPIDSIDIATFPSM